MPVSLNDIIIKVSGALRDSSAILAKAQELFDVPHRIFVGSSGIMSPEMIEAVTFAVTAEQKSAPMGDDRSFTFKIWCGFKRESVLDVMENGVQVVTYDGQARLEEFLDLALAEIRTISSQLDWPDISMTIEEEILPPIWVARLSLTAQLSYVIGAELSL